MDCEKLNRDQFQYPRGGFMSKLAKQMPIFGCFEIPTIPATSHVIFEMDTAVLWLISSTDVSLRL